jgi:hypothetical protein
MDPASQVDLDAATDSTDAAARLTSASSLPSSVSSSVSLRSVFRK